MMRPLSLLCILGILWSCAPVQERTSRQGYVLGTVCTVSAYGADEKLYDTVFAALKDIEERMKVDGDRSEIRLVNLSAGRHSVEVSADTLQVVQTALQFSSLAPGSFDITIGPLVELWGIGKKEQPVVPGREDIEARTSLIDYSLVEIDGKRIFLPKEGMGIDLGGIAKGYAADVARDLLSEAGVGSALLDFGGNILTIGTKPDGSPWKIGIQDPSLQRGRYVGVLSLIDRTAVTSGPYERFFIQDGTRYHHILDPGTGYPAETDIQSATIVTGESIRGDALSTMIFILGLKKGLEVIESLEDTEAVIITKDKEVYITPELEQIFTLADESYTLKIGSP
ncbi:MAG: FAD:protein FMN transferase [Spirochaetales bacterium]|nr:FAD:protein FMN transferase [Spirochaetales bacterium]